MQKKKVIGVSKWTEQEKDDFALAAFSARQEHPEWSWRKCFDEGNKVLPADKPIGARIEGLTQLPWVKKRIDILSGNPDASKAPQKKNSPPVQAAPAAPETTPERKTRVVLNYREQWIFAEAYYKAREEHPKWTWRDLLNAANATLPEGREVSTKIPGPSNLKWLAPLLKEIAERPPVVEEPPAPVEPPPPPTAAPVSLDLQSLIVKAIIDALKPVLLHIIQSNQLQDAIKEVIAPAPVAEKPVDTRRKVLVVGMLPHLGQEITVAYGKHYDLKFMKSETSHHQLKDLLKGVDMPIIMTKFVSHSTQAVLRQHPGMIFCNGNVSALKQILHDRLNQ